MTSMIIASKPAQSSNSHKKQYIKKDKGYDFNSTLDKELSKVNKEVKKPKICEDKSDKKVERSDNSKDKKVKNNNDISIKDDNIEKNILKTGIDELTYLVNSIIDNLDMDKLPVDEEKKLAEVQMLIKELNLVNNNTFRAVKSNSLDDVIKELELINDKVLEGNLLKLTNKTDITQINKSSESNRTVNVLDNIEGLLSELNKNLKKNIVPNEGKVELEETNELSEVKVDQLIINNTNLEEEKKDIVSIKDDTLSKNNDKSKLINQNKSDILINNSNEFDQTLFTKPTNNEELISVDKNIEINTAILDKFDIIGQIKDKIVFTNIDNSNIAKIKLKPEALGEVTIKLSIQEGVVTGKISVENYEIKNMIDNNINQLKESLESKGINVEAFSVSVGEDSQSNKKDNFLYYSRSNKKLDIEEIEESDYLSILSNNYQNVDTKNSSLDIKI